jgi:putative NADPH-quinone reductase
VGARTLLHVRLCGLFLHVSGIGGAVPADNNESQISFKENEVNSTTSVANRTRSENIMSNKTLIIVAHPNLAESQIHAAWLARLAEASLPVSVRNIYQIYPDWDIDAASEQALLENHDRVFLQFPLYWYSVPPLLKKWLDEVFAYGWAYGPGGNKLTNKQIGLIVSTGSVASAYQRDGRIGHTLAELLRPMEQTIRFVGAHYLPLLALQGANQTLTEETLDRSANKYLRHVQAQ